MRTELRHLGSEVAFVLAGLDEREQQAARELAYAPLPEGGFAKTFAAADAGNVEAMYARFARHAPRLLRQALGDEPVPWRAALQHVAERLDDAGVAWWLTGSGALAARGIPCTPRDLDLVIRSADVPALCDALADALVEPPVRCGPDWISEWFGRGFLEARVEWIAEVRAGVDVPHATDFGPVAEQRLERVTWHGRTLLVPPLELQLEVAKRRGLSDRAALITDFIRRARG